MKKKIAVKKPKKMSKKVPEGMHMMDGHMMSDKDMAKMMKKGT